MGGVSVALENAARMSNLLYYAALCASFSLGACVVFFLFGAPPAREMAAPCRVPAWLGVGLGLAVIVAFYVLEYSPVNSPWYVGRGTPRLCVGCAAAIALAFLYAKRFGRAPGKGEAVFFAVYSVALSLVCGWLAWHPYITDTYDIYNFQAYTHDIYHVYNGNAIRSSRRVCTGITACSLRRCSS